MENIPKYNSDDIHMISMYNQKRIKNVLFKKNKFILFGLIRTFKGGWYKSTIKQNEIVPYNYRQKKHIPIDGKLYKKAYIIIVLENGDKYRYYFNSNSDMETYVFNNYQELIK